MSLYTNPAELEKIKAACRAAAEVLDGVCREVRAGITTLQLDEFSGALMSKLGCRSACLGYPGSSRRMPPFPCQICISVNDEIVHGIGSDQRVLSSGDIVSLDVVVEKNGYFGDNARTVAVGQIDPKIENLLRATEQSLYLGIAQAVRGNHMGDIGKAIQAHVEAAGFSVVRDFVGHGVGASMHEEPQIPNFGRRGAGIELKAGMVLAIEPMVNAGDWRMKIDPDGWTARTIDGLPSAHFEHTVYISNKGPQILTKFNGG